jgi:5-methylcytosine-specific restriction endonuclease McrA
MNCPKCQGIIEGTNPYCKPCMRAYNKERNQAKRAYLNEVKLESGCVACGYNAHPAALEFDHLDPTTKLFHVGSRFSSVSFSKLKEEVSKCQVLCSNCHRIKTFDTGQHLNE